MSPPITAVDFLAVVEQSGLLDESVLTPYRQTAESGELAERTSGAIARLLVADRVLTDYQARKLAKGRFRGFILAGKYKILDQLGEGGMGRVLLCEHLILRRLVAVKLMTLSSDAFPAAVERFLREARAAAAVDHRNITRVFDVEPSEAGPCMAMEYVDGTSLQDLVNRHGPLSFERAAHYISQAATGLQHAHEAGLVHRDVKPANILLDRSGTIKLLDLGLARFFETRSNDNLTQKFDEKVVLGTADYIAPEQAVNSSRVDIRADLYSLGCTLYFLLTGKPPFEGGTMVEKLMKHQNSACVPVHHLRPEVPEELSEVLAKMLQKRPEDRYQTPAELVVALTRWTRKSIAPPTAKEMPQVAAQSYRLGLSAAPRMSSRKIKSLEVTPAMSATDRETQRQSDVQLATVSAMASIPMALSDSGSFLPQEASKLTLPSQSPKMLQKTPRVRRPAWQWFAFSAMLMGLLAGAAIALLLGERDGASARIDQASNGANATGLPVEKKPVAAPPAPFSAPGASLRAGGSSFIAPLMEHWTPLVLEQAGIQLDYASLGSSKGVEGVIGRFFDFGCTDAYVTDEQMAASTATLVHIPLALGAVVPTYNVNDSTGKPLKLRFTGPLLANIFLGRVKRWNDPTIAVANPGKSLPDLPIFVVHRADGSGTTFIWTDYLGKASAEWKWQVGTGNRVSWPTGTGAEKNDGVADTVSRTNGAIGYVELSYAMVNGLQVGQVKNRAGVFVEPSIDSVTAAATASLDCISADLRYSLTDATGKSSYPIAGSCWAVIDIDQPADKRSPLVTFLHWATHEGQRYVRDLRYAPLPVKWLPRIDAAIERVKSGR